jgi:hypothetical protein
MKSVKFYMVVSPAFDVLGDMIAPGEYIYESTRDVVEVSAYNKKNARVKGVREFRRMRSGYLDTAINPFAGVTVEECGPDYRPEDDWL